MWTGASTEDDMDNTYWKHVKSKGVYTVLHSHATREHDLEPVTVYQALRDGTVWVRPAEEFFDGRFEEVELED